MPQKTLKNFTQITVSVFISYALQICQNRENKSYKQALKIALKDRTVNILMICRYHLCNVESITLKIGNDLIFPRNEHEVIYRHLSQNRS